MSKMKKGTVVGLDKNFANICVGDSIWDEDGVEYTINAYGLAVAVKEGGTHKISDLKGVYVLDEVKPAPECKECEVKDEKPKAEEEKEKPDKKLIIITEKFLSKASDKELVEELRARGYKVKAYKKTIIEL